MNIMTPYAESLITYVRQNIKKSREEAISYLDEFASPLWQMSVDQPSAHGKITVVECKDEGV